MNCEIEDLSEVKKRFLIEIEVDEVDAEFKTAYDKLRSETEVEGFRKGKAPDSVLKQRFGDGIEVKISKTLVDRTFLKAVEDSGLKLIASPDIDASKIVQGSPFRYSATVDVRPGLNIDNFMDMEIATQTEEVTDEEVEKNLTMLRERNCRYKDTDQPVVEGTMVTIDVQAKIDGELFKEGSQHDYSFKVGEGTNFPEFEECVLGHRVYDTPSFLKSFPDQYHDKKVAGKEVAFVCSLKNVRGKELPPLNNDFAKSMQCNTVDDLKVMIRQELGRVKIYSERDRQRKEYMEKMVELNPFKVPDSLVENYFTRIMGKMFEGVRMGKVNPDGWSLNTKEAKEKYREQAVKQAKGDIIFDAICERVKVEVTREDVEKAITDIAASKNTTPEEIQKRLEDQGTMEMLADSIRKEKVFDVILGGKLEEQAAAE